MRIIDKASARFPDIKRLPVGREHLFEPVDLHNNRHVTLVILFVGLAVSVNLLVFSFLVQTKDAVQASNASTIVAGKGIKISNNEIMVKFATRDTNKIKSIASKRAFTGSRIKSFEKVVPSASADSEIGKWYKVTLDVTPRKVPARVRGGKVESEGTDAVPIVAAVNDLKTDAEIADAEPNLVVQSSIAPNDSYYNSSGLFAGYPDMWGLKRINPEPAWDKTVGGGPVVAVIDTGVNKNHEDIHDNIWTNPAEIAGNGKDDDGNGYVDDTWGWDFVNNDNDPVDDTGHGSFTSGVILAKGNNSAGVVGVDWTGKIMAIKALDSNGAGSGDKLAAALVYAANRGAKISNNSWNGGPSQLIADAITYEVNHGMIVVMAAGNDNADMGQTIAAQKEILTVSATDKSDNKASFSAFGDQIDVAAPGVDIVGIYSAGGYALGSGTSFSAPFVSGEAALIWAKNPSWSRDEVIADIRNSADKIAGREFDRNFGYGRINVGNALLTAQAPPVAKITSPGFGAGFVVGNYKIDGIATASAGFASYKISVGLGSESTSFADIVIGTSAVSGNLGNLDTSTLASGKYTIRLEVVDKKGAISVDRDVVNIVNPNPVLASPIPSPTPTVTPSSSINCIYDVNHDGVVNSTDLQQAAAHFGLVPANSPYDVNKNGIVNSTDLQQIAIHMGQRCP